MCLVFDRRRNGNVELVSVETLLKEFSRSSWSFFRCNLGVKWKTSQFSVTFLDDLAVNSVKRDKWDSLRNFDGRVVSVVRQSGMFEENRWSWIDIVVAVHLERRWSVSEMQDLLFDKRKTLLHNERRSQQGKFSWRFKMNSVETIFFPAWREMTKLAALGEREMNGEEVRRYKVFHLGRFFVSTCQENRKTDFRSSFFRRNVRLSSVESVQVNNEPPEGPTDKRDRKPKESKKDESISSFLFMLKRKQKNERIFFSRRITRLFFASHVFLRN